MGEYVFKLPDVGEGTAEAEIVAWHVAVGDRIEEDQPLVDVMTDKATVEMTTPVSGIVVSVHGELGDMAAVGSPLAVIAVDGEASSEPTSAATRPAAKPAAKPAARAQSSSPSQPKPAAAPVRSQASAPVARILTEKPLAAPSVRRRAQELGVRLQFVPGTGPAGRISNEDLDAFLASGGADAPQAGRRGGVQREGVESVKVIGLRRKIAEKMQESKRRIPHFAYIEEIDVTELEALRVHLNSAKAEDRPRLTMLPFLITALVRALPRYPQINARFDDDAGVVDRHQGVHVGIATQTPGGLIVPVLRHAEARDLWDCAAEIARLAAVAREGKASADELKGSTITVTSLGPLGGVATTPVINYPEVAIIGPNKIVERPVVQAGQIVVRKMMNLSSCFDHRVVDGYDAASFIQVVKGYLEHPATLFMDVA
jgi:2-oxoisovalerate dehydrogenase E2 component (dihydrolipoyl transacylase)